MKNNKDSKLLLQLLEDSELFGDKAKSVVRAAVEEKVLPQIDFEYILYILKMDKNLMHVIDTRADKMLKKLRKKYGIT
jgi:hypothetical protein